MTPTEQDKELREKVAAIIEYWDFSPLQDEDSRIERLRNEIMQLITADRKRVALEARINELEKIEIGGDNIWTVDSGTDTAMLIEERIAELKRELDK